MGASKKLKFKFELRHESDLLFNDVNEIVRMIDELYGSIVGLEEEIYPKTQNFLGQFF